MSRGPRGRGSVFEDRARGRWIAQLKVDGKLHRRVRKTEGAALNALDDLRERERKGLGLNAPITLGKHIDEWLEHLDVRPHTREGYESKLKLVPSSLRAVRLDRLRPAQLRKLFDELRASQSPRSVAHVRSILRNCLRRAVQDGLIERNPAQLTDPPRVPNVERRTLNYEQAVRLLEVVRGERLEALFVLALHLGMRQSELLGLRWGDVDLKPAGAHEHALSGAGYDPTMLTNPGRSTKAQHSFGASILHVRQTLHRVKGGTVLTPPKTRRSERAIPLPPDVAETLRRHRIAQREEYLVSGARPTEDLVFTMQNGAPLNPSTVLRQLYRHLDALEIPRVTFHDLRHAAASILQARGFTPREVMSVLGHSSYVTTMNLYSHPEQDDIAAKMQAENWS